MSKVGNNESLETTRQIFDLDHWGPGTKPSRPQEGKEATQKEAPVRTYGHLMPGAEAEAASLLDAFLAVQSERAAEGARAAAVL